MNFREQEHLYQAFRKSRAASAPVITPPCPMIVSDNPDRLTTSKAASSSTQYETVVKKYDMSLPSTGDQVYKCGIHDFETKNLTEFNRHLSTKDHGSKAASVPVNKLQEILRFQKSNGRL